MRRRLISFALLALIAFSAAAQNAPPQEDGVFRTPDLVELIQLDPSLRLDIRYATSNNFVGQPVYGEARAFLQRPAAIALLRVQGKAKAKGYGLQIFDGYRPWHVTKLFWDKFPHFREYLGDPAQGSRHNRGCTVDLTLFNLQTGAEVPMPSGYDDFTERAHPAYQGGTVEQRVARDLLRALMESEGFSVYENEWWHFDCNGWREYPIMDVRFSEIGGV